MQGFVYALGFLTRIPVPHAIFANDSARRASPRWYAAVGLGIGALLCLLAMPLGTHAPLLGSALLVTAWVVMTGGLHIDGLADSADAWIGGLGARERTLAIMKDPRCGPAGVISVVLVLVVKIAVLAGLDPHTRSMSLLIVPFLGRAALTVLLATTPYARQSGLGRGLDEMGTMLAAMIALSSLIVCVLAVGPRGFLVFAFATVAFLLWRRAGVRRLGGFTGDTAGAMVELVETAALVVMGLAVS